jgi:hypothetical protein
MIPRDWIATPIISKASDRFPPAIRTACEQYLLYFVQFLEDLGVSATAEIKEDAKRVLFSVTPTDGCAALQQIREALEVYLKLPEMPEFGTAVVGCSRCGRPTTSRKYPSPSVAAYVS